MLKKFICKNVNNSTPLAKAFIRSADNLKLVNFSV